MANYQPGVYVTQKDYAPAQAPVKSAVPIFIGYTQIAAPFVLHAVDSFAVFERTFGGPHIDEALSGRLSVLYYAVKHYFEVGGGGGFALSLGSYEDAARSTEQEIINAFKDGKIQSAIAGQLSISLIMIPDMVLLPDTALSYWQDAWQAVLTLCCCRSGIFGILDTPDNPTDAINCLASFEGWDREWAAAYWPRLVVSESAERPIIIPASTAVAAVIESVDEEEGVWTAPANKEMLKIIDVTHSHLEMADSFVVSAASYNVIRSFPGRGVRVWGCRTLSQNSSSPFLYVQIRRLVSYIAINVSQLVQVFIFEPNNEITWFKVKGQTTNWLRKLWLNGGLFGNEEDQAFRVSLGLNETMTQQDLLEGRMILNISLSVLYPAEFINLSLEFDLSVGLTKISE